MPMKTELEELFSDTTWSIRWKSTDISEEQLAFVFILEV
jgi:hypothetical protein